MFIKLGDVGRSEEKRPKTWKVGIGLVLSCQFKAKQSTRDLFLVVYLLTCWLASPFFWNLLLATKDLAGQLCRNLLLSNQDLEDELQPQLQFQQLCQNNPTTTSSNPIIYQRRNYMDHDRSINFMNGGRSMTRDQRFRRLG